MKLFKPAIGMLLNVAGCLLLLLGCYLISASNPMYYLSFAVGIVLIAIGYRVFYSDEDLNDFEDFEN